IGHPAICAEEFTGQFTGKVVAISDGDTIKVMHCGQPEKVRLNAVDCPESSQAFGQKAKKYTAKLCFRKEVTVNTFNKDKYGRTIGEVILPHHKNLNEELVRAGYAWWYRKYASDNKTLEALETEAREHHRGLWKDKDKDPEEPWHYRQRQRMN